MSVNIKTRALVFATFFGSTLIIGLLVAALTTEYWIESHAKKANNEKASGRIKFGLFGGTKVNIRVKVKIIVRLSFFFILSVYLFVVVGTEYRIWCTLQPYRHFESDPRRCDSIHLVATYDTWRWSWSCMFIRCGCRVCHTIGECNEKTRHHGHTLREQYRCTDGTIYRPHRMDYSILQEFDEKCPTHG